MTKSLILAVLSASILLLISLDRVGGWKVEDGKGWKGEEVKFLHVGGKVMCQDCTHGWNQWAHGATPLKGSKVAVTCMDTRKRVVYHSDGETDERGEFELAVSNRVNGKVLKPEAGCSVRLVSSSDTSCSILTNFGGGKSGVKLFRPTQMYPGMIRYTVGPFYFTSPMCDEPDTSESAKGNNGY